MTGAGIGTHSLFCTRIGVIRKAQEHINLSTTERDMLIGLGPHENPCCNCKVGLQGSRASHKTGDILVVEAIALVLSRRKAWHPAQIQVGWVEGEGREERDTGGIMRDDDDAGEVCDVIRIDFKNRRRII